MAFTTDEEPKSDHVFIVEMGALLLLPPIVLGLGLAAVSGVENFLPGFGIGAIVGVGAAKLRNEIRGARTGS
ncbi:hypothetical protein [Natrarchaeobaculum aegyptiacum]|uniref:Uncharacterized protein n=1 Tax=Natrarchaeobaculum aegyptiacum TaxID=745377 RepID=A0A2Z2HUD5_9EURY|nr:hypothetical protein [Natrarchaeobaculum aegyptiacum]ARS90383.1 hypothetical protein B1756_12030 [Natrarchaeobaculum aegyptiacum]